MANRTTGGFDETNELARLQDEPREDQPEDYKDRKPHEYASEQGEQTHLTGEKFGQVHPVTQNMTARHLLIEPGVDDAKLGRDRA